MKITVDVAERDLPFLAVLSPVGDPAAVLAYLAAEASDGVRRPGAWERGWVEQAFGDDFHQLVEPDPDVRWYVRPRAGAHP